MVQKLIESIERYEEDIKLGKVDSILSSYNNLIDVKNDTKEKIKNKSNCTEIKIKVGIEDIDIESIVKELEKRIKKNINTIHAY